MYYFRLKEPASWWNDAASCLARRPSLWAAPTQTHNLYSQDRLDCKVQNHPGRHTKRQASREFLFWTCDQSLAEPTEHSKNDDTLFDTQGANDYKKPKRIHPLALEHRSTHYHHS